jgi:predicted anti-sigma-YlaC factor YlaD
MTRALTHDEAFDVLDALAFDVLDATERLAVETHLAGCETCRIELAQLRETAAMIAFAAHSATETTSRDRVHARLMARAAADTGATTATNVPIRTGPPRTSRVETPTRVIRPSRAAVSAIAWRRAEWMAVAAGILLVVSVAVLAGVLRDRQNLRLALNEQVGRSQRASVTTDSLRVALMSRDSMIAGLTGRDVAMMTLTSGGTKSPYAHMFWDKAHSTWTMVAHNMPNLKPGRTYQLWLVTSDKKISAGTFEARDGDAMMRATMPINDKLMALAVTEEPMGGMPQPTGSMVMAANAH